MPEYQRGNLRFSPKALRQILEQLSNPKAVFTLHISDGPNERVVYFAGGGVRLLSVGERCGVGLESYLLDRRILTVEQLHEVLEASRASQRSIKQVLLDKEIISDQQYAEVVNKLIRDELYDLVFWDDAYFACYTESPPKEIYTQNNKALIGSPKWADLEDDVSEWTKKWEQFKPLFRSDRAVLEATKRGVYGLEKLEGDEKRCLESCLNPIDLGSLWRTSALELPCLCEKLEHFFRKKWITISSPPRERSDDPLAEEIERLEASLPHVLGKDLVREKLLALYRKAKLPSKAVEQLEQLAASAQEKGQWPLVVERYKKILSIKPERLDILQKTLKTYVGQRMEKEAVAAANSHAQNLLEANLPDEARKVAKMVRSITGSNPESQSVFAAVCAGTGDQEGAVDQYLAIAAEYEDKRSRADAIRVLRQALRVCQGNPRILEQLERLDPEYVAAQRQAEAREKTKIRKKRPARKKRWTRALAILAVLALAAAGALHWAGVLPIPESFAKGWASGAGEERESEDGGGFSLAKLLRGAFRNDKGTRGDERTAVEWGHEGADGEEGAGAKRVVELGGVTSPEEGEEGEDVRDLFGVRESGDGDRDSEPWLSEILKTRGTSGEFTSPSRDRSPSPPSSPRRSTRAAGGSRSAGSGGLPTAAQRAGPGLGRAPRQRKETEAVAEAAQPVSEFNLFDYQLHQDWKALRRGRDVIPEGLLDRCVRETCSHERRHELESRLTDKYLLVTFGNSCNLLGFHPVTGRRLFRVPAKVGFRWAVSHRGERICRWKPGHRALIHNSKNDTSRTTSWTFRKNAAAVAIGLDRVAVREGRQTVLYDLDGRILRRSELPQWDAGAFVDDSLILTRTRANESGPRGIWVIHTPTWLPMWCSTEEQNAFEIR